MDVEDLSGFSCFFECHSNSIKNWLSRDNLHYIYCHHLNFRKTMGNCMYLWAHQPFIQIATTFFSKSLNLSQFLLLTVLCFTLWCSLGVDKEDFVWMGPGQGMGSLAYLMDSSSPLLYWTSVKCPPCPQNQLPHSTDTPLPAETISVEIFFEIEKWFNNAINSFLIDHIIVFEWALKNTLHI